MVMHAYSSSSREEEVWRRESKFNLSYMVRPCQKKKNQTIKKSLASQFFSLNIQTSTRETKAKNLAP